MFKSQLLFPLCIVVNGSKYIIWIYLLFVTLFNLHKGNILLENLLISSTLVFFQFGSHELIKHNTGIKITYFFNSSKDTAVNKNIFYRIFRLSIEALNRQRTGINLLQRTVAMWLISMSLIPLGPRNCPHQSDSHMWLK